MSLEIRPVISERDIWAFDKLGLSLYRELDLGLRPLHTRSFLRESHPYYRRARSQTWVAFDGKHAIGRIAATIDHRRFDDGTGIVGLFDSVESKEVSHALLHVAQDWLRVRGARRAIGPLLPGAIVNGGLMTSGFEEPNPQGALPGHPYYWEHWESAGWKHEIDLYTWKVGHQPAPKQVRQIARLVQERRDLEVRRLSKTHFERDLDLMTMIYNAAWAGTWGWVPADREDLRAYLQPDLIDFEVSRLVFIASKPAAMAIVMPNRTPLSNLSRPQRVLSRLMRPETFRVALFGVVPEYRGHKVGGLAIHLYIRMLHAARMAGYHSGEATFTSSLDEIPNNGMAIIGAELAHTYRICSKSFV